ncbi:MAG: PIN domain-containing protein [Anaerolineales bacterium]|nr:PIN domain-containing protein [Anaerolineales bacterium]
MEFSVLEYLADTVTLIRHLGNHPKLGEHAAQLLKEADAGQHRIYVSAITLMEVLYLADANRIKVPLQSLISQINRSRNYQIVPVDANVVLAAVAVTDVPELHDRIIAATASHLGVPILTGDTVIAASRHVTVIW